MSAPARVTAAVDPELRLVRLACSRCDDGSVYGRHAPPGAVEPVDRFVAERWPCAAEPGARPA